MSERNKIIAGWIAFVFILFHFAFIFVFAFPSDRISPELKKVVTPYVDPLFEQQWAMFAPCPVVDGGIYMKFYNESDSTEWIRPAEEAVFWHRWLRVTHLAEVALLESNLIHWVNADIFDLNLNLNEPIPDDRVKFFKEGYSYILLWRYARGTSRNLNFENSTYCKMRCDLENVETGESGSLFIPKIQLK